MKRFRLSTLVQNLYSLCVYDYHKDDLQLRKEVNYLSERFPMWNIRLSILRYLTSAEGNRSECFDELAYVVDNMELPGFPYPQIKTLEQIIYGFDSKKGMPYIVHDDKRLYFPQTYNEEKCRGFYRSLIENEQILSGGYMLKAPHCYQTETFKVDKGDVLVDAGAAEGLFSLHLIDKIAHAYIIESDVMWIPALRATFAPYENKVTIINKTIGNVSNEHQVTLSEILDHHPEPCFVKMDIEGAEPMVIEGSEQFLAARDNVRIACCTYHYDNDAQRLSELFGRMGYRHEYSDGYVFHWYYEMPAPPFLRHVLIRANK